MPTTRRSIQVADKQIAELSMLCGFDDDLATQITHASNRVRGLLTQIHPTLERVLGPRLDHPAVLVLIEQYPSPSFLRQAGTKRVAARLLKKTPRKEELWAGETFDAHDQQSVTVVGTGSAQIVLPCLAKQIIELRKQHAQIAVEVEKIVEVHPLHTVLTSMPGVGVRTAARLLTEIVGKYFPTGDTSPPTLASHWSPDVPGPRSAENRLPDVSTKS